MKRKPSPILVKFLADPHAKRYVNLLRSQPAHRSLDEFLAFFDSPDTIRRMIESERHHDRPAIAGIVRDLDAMIAKHLAEATGFGDQEDAGLTHTRRNQLFGVVVRLAMEGAGWKPTGKKGSLVGLSKFFKRGERYAPVDS